MVAMEVDNISNWLFFLKENNTHFTEAYPGIELLKDFPELFKKRR